MWVDDAKERLRANLEEYNKVSKKQRLKETCLWGGLMTLALLVFFTIMFLFKVKMAKAEALMSSPPERGYFFYQCPEGTVKNDDDVCVKVEEPKKEEEKPKQAEITAKKASEKQEKEEFEFPVLDTAPPIMKRFLKDPSEENATEYLAWQYKYMQHLKKIGYSIRNAYLRFGGDVYPIQGYPEGPLASIYYNGVKESMYKKVLEPLKDKLGFIYFYSQDSPGYKQQSEIIGFLRNKYNLSIRGVSVDENVDYTLPFFTTYNPALAKQFGITQLPSVIAVYDKNGEPRVAGLSAGFTALDMIEQQLVRFLIQEGAVREKDLNPVMFETGR